ncbi:hypothetical protein FIU89_11305 [Roseovarius sp. THAF27]|nr:hypothetical protein FIU89_11305 [Roseovarius sp. THAF27]
MRTRKMTISTTVTEDEIRDRLPRTQLQLLPEPEEG